jgi:hypothetical protein
MANYVLGKSGAQVDSILNSAITAVTATLTTGTEIGTVGGVTLYAPAPMSVTASLTSGTAIATVGGVTIYAPAYTDADGVKY